MAILERELTTGIDDIAEKVYSGERLTWDDGRRLMHHHNLPELGALADYVRWKFCAFYRVPGHEEGYTLSREEIFDKIQQMVDLGGIEILMQGGLNPKLKIEWYEDLLRAIKAKFGAYGVINHAFSPAALIYIQ